MTRSDFIQIANIIRRTNIEGSAKRKVIWSFAKLLREFYPTFNSAKFVALCETPWDENND